MTEPHPTSDPEPAEKARNAAAARAEVAALFELPPESPLLDQALTHASLANEQTGVPDNQRLEFLGDAILGFLTSELLYERFPELDEGGLTRLRAQLVNAESLAQFGMQTPVPDVVRLGKGADEGRLRQSLNVIADAVEALIAATYLESGMHAAKRVCAKVAEFGLLSGNVPLRDPKSELQERAQAVGLQAPTYELIEAVGPAHARLFRVEARISGLAVGRGEGRSKRDAERDAARDALVSGVWQEQLAKPAQAS